MKVIVDNRETEGRIKKSKKFFNEVEVKKLDSGDYVCGGTAIEFKTTDDFIASVLDKRVFNQAVRMNQEYENTYIIIYGDVYSSIKKKQRFVKGFTINSYLGAIASLSQIIRVLKVDNEHQAFNLMKRLFIKSNDGKNRNIIKIKNDDNKLVGVVMYFAGVNSDKATAIIKENKIKSFKDLLEINKDDLLKISGVGDKTASKFLSYIKE